ncbi:hypothetical protein NC77_29090 [Janthinobacterium lividum]|nr:hypothetical protein NC77_29090 [Janthinobacterium lividum]
MERRRHLRRRHHADADSHPNADSNSHANPDPGAYAEPDAHSDANANRRHLRAGVGGRHGLQRGRHRQLCGHELPRQLLDAGRQSVDQQRRRRHGQAVDQPGDLQYHADTYSNPDADAYSNADSDAYSNTDSNSNSNSNTYSNANGPRSRLLFCAVGRVWPRL